jgi:hypothetical protein
MKESNLPSLIKLVDKEEAKGGITFEKLVKKLLIHDSRLKGYRFEMNPKYRRLEIDGLVKEHFPEVEGVVIFQVKRLRSSARLGATSYQVRKIFQHVVNSRAIFSAYILVSPEDLTAEQEEWLAKLRKTHNLDLRNYGQAKIMELLEQYPALEKYYYGKYIKTVPQDYNLLAQDYCTAVVDTIKDVEFIGLPTAQYQKRDLLKKTELSKVYIPLKFRAYEGHLRTKELSVIKDQFKRLVILGDPGAGKSTLTKYLALDSCRKDNDIESEAREDKIAFIIPLSDFVGVKRTKSRSFDFVDYLKFTADNHYYFDNIDRDFFVAMLELGKALVIFDGLDEIASENWRSEVVKDIERFADDYPDNSIWVTSRTFGYKKTTGFKHADFRHFYLMPISPGQVEMFIRNWYEIQIPTATHKEEKIKTLQKTLSIVPYMHWFKKNPLFLTLLAILNQFEEQLPNNRTTLYEKCLELLLRTWPNRKYSAVGKKNPIEEVGINYDKQLELLSAIAVNIQDRYRDKIKQDIEEGILIPEKELLEILFEARYDRERMTEDDARKDVKEFLDYIVDRTGFLMEIRKENVGEDTIKHFSFIHRSFREYLYARSRSKDAGLSEKEHSDFIVRYMGRPVWQEVILFYLLLLKEHLNQNTVDRILKTILQAISSQMKPDNWLVMGMAVRDNIGFDDEAVKRINSEILKQWFEAPENRTVYSILQDIVYFSGKGKILLRKLILSQIIQNNAETAFAAFYLLKQFYHIDDNILELLECHKDKDNLLSYMPIYRNEAIISRLLDKNVNESHWVRYYNTISDKILDTLERVIAYQMGDYELKGFILSSWGEILEIFRQRCLFLADHKKELNGEKSSPVNLDYSYVALGFEADRISLPLRLFKQFVLNPRNIDLVRITDSFFISQDRAIHIQGSHEYLVNWAKDVLVKIFSAFNQNLPKSKQFNSRELEHIENRSQLFAKEFVREFSRYLHLPQLFGEEIHLYMLKYLNKGNRFLSESFKKYLSWYFRKEFEQPPHRGVFSSLFIRRLSRDISRAFSRYFRYDLTRDLRRDLLNSFLGFVNQDPGSYFRQDFREYLNDTQSQELKKEISTIYSKILKKRLNWDNLSADQFELVYKVFLNEFDQVNLSLVDHFYIYLYEYLFNHKFDISFESEDSSGRYLSKDNIIIVPKTHLPINNPFMIPFTFNFILAGALSHYFIKLLANLNGRFYKKPGPSKDVILEAVEDYCFNYPFVSYFIHYSWDYFCEKFKAQYQYENEHNSLRLACFIMQAAKLSLVTDMPCSGDAWGEILKEAEKSESLFVQISLSLYRLCNHIETAKESGLLEKLLEKFKTNYPGYYSLIGFSS